MALPPYLDGSSFNINQWCGPVPVGVAGSQEDQVSPSPYVNGQGYGDFSGGVFTSAQFRSPTITYIPTFTLQANRRYTIEIHIKKMTAGSDCYIKPGFILFNSGFSVVSPQPGVYSTFPGWTTLNNRTFDASNWPIGVTQVISGYWYSNEVPSATQGRVRCRINRGANNFGADSGSSASFQISKFVFKPQIWMSDIKNEFGGAAEPHIVHYYKGGTRVPQTSVNANVPTSGPIKFSNFFSASAVNATPNWIAPAAGSLGNRIIGQSYTVTLQASDADGATVTYSLVSGTLPPGLSITGNTLSGTPTTGGSYSFTLGASDGTAVTQRAFSMNVAANGSPTWNTGSNLGSFAEGTALNITLSATDPEGGSVTYSHVGGSLPPGTSVSGNKLLGTIGSISVDTPYSFSLRASDGIGGFTDQTFNLTVTNINDVTPDPVNWSNTSASGDTDDSFVPGISIGGNSNTQTITGIEVPITLRATCSRALASGENLACYVNGSLYGGDEMTVGESTMNVTVNNGDTVLWRFGGFYTTTVTFTITNTTDGNAVLDTFTSSLTKTNGAQLQWSQTYGSTVSLSPPSNSFTVSGATSNGSGTFSNALPATGDYYFDVILDSGQDTGRVGWLGLSNLVGSFDYNSTANYKAWYYSGAWWGDAATFSSGASESLIAGTYRIAVSRTNGRFYMRRTSGTPSQIRIGGLPGSTLYLMALPQGGYPHFGATIVNGLAYNGSGGLY